MPKADLERTAARKFKDPDSFVFKDGREFLRGDDWEDRKFELLTRARGICEHESGCRREGEHPHHRIKRSLAHDDRLTNLVLLCVKHHREEHPEKEPQWTRRTA